MESNGDINKKSSRDPSPDILSNGLEAEDSSESSENQQFICGICNEKFKVPKVLHCLHVFCAECLEKSLVDSGPTQLVCHKCKQITRLTMVGGVNELPVDAVIVNLMEMEAICSMQVICTSCKAQEKAVARCSDCSNFLCSNCVTAHNYMRCFDGHKVDTFEELKSGKGIHKPMFCSLHPNEHFKFYCKTCQVLTCAECMLYLHKQPDHHCERVLDLDQEQRSELKSILAETKCKVNALEDTSGKLESLLSDLQQQRDNAHDLIKETFQSFKAALEKRKDELIGELEIIHSQKELTIMEMFHNLGKTADKMEDACKFLERLIEHTDAVEMMALNKIVRAQMLTLNDEVPRSDMNVKIEVESDLGKYVEATRQFFCAFKRQESALPLSSASCGRISNKPPLFDVQLNHHQHHHQLHNTNGLANSSHHHHHHSSSNSSNNGLLPTNSNSSIPPLQPQSSSTSFDMDRFKMLDPSSTSLNLPAELLNSLAANLAPPLLNDLASTIAATSLASNNNNNLSSLSQTLSFAERSLSRNSYSPTISDSGVSVDVSSTSNQQTLLQLQQLIKMGNIGLNPQGQLTVNGQVIPGFQGINWNLPGGLVGQASPPQNNPACGGGRGIVPPIPSDNSLASLLSSTSGTSNNALGGGGTTPSISELSALLNSLNSHQSISLGAMQSTSPINSGGTGPVNMLSGGQAPPNLPLNGVFPVPSSSYPAQGPSSIRARSSGKTNSMEIRTKFGQLGPGKGQFNAPHGFCLGMDEDIVVADTNNHRIQVFDKSGEFKYQFGIPGREEGQLWYPRKVAVIRMTGRYVVCDRGSERSRMQLFSRTGQFLKKIAIRYIDIVAGLAITNQGHIVAVDSVSPTVFCISETGELIKWFDCSDYMREPSDIAVSGKDYYVCDFKGHCVVVFNEDGQFLHRIGCETITNYPNGIDISDAGDVLIGDSHGNRFHVAVFQRDGSLIGEFECPYVKVSRCCGLKITSEGYIVTLAKNNQHVLVLNTLYIA